MDNLTNVCEATSQSQDLANIRPTHRKGKKLLAEKKRRARINNCLMQIRHLVCEEQEEKDTDLDKMEKAEILEKTLEVLTRLRHESSKSSNVISTRKAMAIRYASGFSSCAEESIRYIQNSRLVPSEVKIQLQNHLRAIARRMEAIMQVDNHGANCTQGFSASSSFSSERLASTGMLREDASNSSVVERVSGQFPSHISEVGSYYVASPVHFSTPLVHQHLPVISTSSAQQEQEQKLTNYSHEAHNKCNIDPNITSTEKSIGEQTFSTDCKSMLDQPELYRPESTHVKQCHLLHSSLSSEPSFSPSMSSMCGVMPSVNSPMCLHPSPVLPTTPIFPFQAVYAYSGYEPYPTTPSTQVQSTKLSSSSSLISSVVKQLNTPGNAIDLCVKRMDDQQISPETMWRPW